MNVSFISLGCDKNRVNTEQMMALCLQAGHTVQEDCSGSDVVVINTCGFIDSAKSEAIDTILAAAELKAAGEVGKILVTGCLSQRYQADILEELPEIDGIMGTGCFGDIVTALEQVVNGQECRHFADINGPVEELPRVLSTPRQYAYLRIAEGCSNRCAYCVIPSLIVADLCLPGDGVNELVGGRGAGVHRHRSGYHPLRRGSVRRAAASGAAAGAVQASLPLGAAPLSLPRQSLRRAH